MNENKNSTWVDHDDAPDLSNPEWVEKIKTKGVRGRPPGRTKQQVTVSLDIDLITFLKGDNPKGWQTRLNDAARKGLKINS